MCPASHWGWGESYEVFVPVGGGGCVHAENVCAATPRLFSSPLGVGDVSADRRIRRPIPRVFRPRWGWGMCPDGDRAALIRAVVFRPRWGWGMCLQICASMEHSLCSNWTIPLPSYHMSVRKSSVCRRNYSRFCASRGANLPGVPCALWIRASVGKLFARS